MKPDKTIELRHLPPAMQQQAIAARGVCTHQTWLRWARAARRRAREA